MPLPERLELWAVGWPEIQPGTDLVALLCAIDGLRDGDVVLVTSKVVGKAESRIAAGSRDDAIGVETRRVVARRGATVIAQTHHGLVLAAAGVDASNTPAGTVVLLPTDPDGSARRLRDGVYAATGRNVAVIVTDTAGRAWRLGQTDLAVGCAGLSPLVDLAGSRDQHGNLLLVTAPAVADELSGAADLVKGKARGRPVAVARGMAHAVLAPGDHGPGAAGLIRPAGEDLFGLGARDAVIAAVHRSDPVALAAFPDHTGADLGPFDGLVERWTAELPGSAAAALRADLASDDCPAAASPPVWTLRVGVHDGAGDDAVLVVGRLLERADMLAAAHRLEGHDHPLPASTDARTATAGHRPVVVRCWQAQPRRR